MDISTLVSSLITGGVAVLVCIINNNTTMKKRDIEQEKALAVIQTKLEMLVDDVKRLSGFSSKIPSLEAKVANLEQRVNNLEK